MTSNLFFNISINDPLNSYSAYYSAIRSHIQAAGALWDIHIGGLNTNLEVVVNFDSDIPRATGRSVTSSFVRNNGIYNIFEQGAAAEIRTGIDPNEDQPDIELNFNPDYLINELWFDPNPSTRTALVPTNKTDAVSVFLHELGHAFAFNGWMDGITGTMPGDYQSPFDEKVSFDGTNFFFDGAKAISIYGSPVPITYGNPFHLGNNSPRPGSNLIPDLMNGIVYNRGIRYNISNLDVAILTDTGVPITSNSLPEVTLTLSPSSVLENGTPNLIYTFTRIGSLATSLTVNFTVGGSATFNSDYTQIGAASFNATTGSISFQPNVATKTLTIDPRGDTTLELDETVLLTLADNPNYSIGTKTPVTGTILNDDAAINLTLDYSGISENSPGKFTYTFTRNGFLNATLSVNFSIAGSANTADYTQTGATILSPTTGQVTFAAGAATASVVIDPTEDTIVEPNEALSLQLTAGTGYTIGTTRAFTATILNDDGTRRQVGTVGADVILGTARSDIIIGRSGSDSLTGGAGGDLFTFQNSSEGNDRITDFVPGDDTIVVRAGGFAGGLVSGDAINPEQFFIGSAATSTLQRFVYNSTTGLLSFDRDGNGVAPAVALATLNPGLSLTFEDIFVS